MLYYPQHLQMKTRLIAPCANRFRYLLDLRAASQMNAAKTPDASEAGAASMLPLKTLIAPK
ncbi:MAG: hypothetical protein FWG22_06720 [Prolixibacteraceae bacterium]|nr:hypothetical protein [Prolixibacteraceae bacterium]